MTRIVAWLSKFTLFFVIFELMTFGLFAYRLDPINHRSVASRNRVIICALSGLTMFGSYLWVALNLLADPALAYFYNGIAYYTIVLRNVFSFLLIIVFYAFQLIKRNSMIKFLNELNDSFESFGLFYSAQTLNISALDKGGAETLREIKHVYRPVFIKVVLHLIIIGTKLLMGIFMHADFPESNLGMLIYYLVLPYIIQSATSSYMLLGLRKSSYLYVAMTEKLKQIHGEVKQLVKNEDQSQFAKMKRFCELSDQVDSLGASFDKITSLTLELTESYNVHTLLILGYTVSNNLTLFYQQYMGLTGDVIHNRVLATEIIFILINVGEILLVIGSVEEAETMFRRVLKEVHLINYWQKSFDCRLKQSVSGFL